MIRLRSIPIIFATLLFIFWGVAMSILFNWALNSTELEGNGSNLVVAENTVAVPLETTEKIDERSEGTRLNSSH